MATTTINTNDSKIFAVGASGAGSPYTSQNVGSLLAFNFTGTQLEGALDGFFNIYIDDPTRSSPSAIHPLNGNGIANVLVTGLADTSHTVEILATGSSNVLTTGALFRATGSAPAFASSTLYPNHLPFALGTGNLIGDRSRDTTHIRVDGGLQQNFGGQGTNVVGCSDSGYGGSVTFYGAISAIKFFTANGAFTGPGGMYISIDGATPVYYSSAPYYSADNSGRMFQVITGLDSSNVHKYELRHGWNLSGCYLTDLILVGGTGLDTTHTLPVRKKLYIYGDSIANDFATATGSSPLPPPPQDQYFDVVAGDRGFGAYIVANTLDLALFISSFPALSVTNLQNVGTKIGTQFGSQSNWTDADYIFFEPGINDLGNTEQANWPANYTAMISGAASLFTKAGRIIWCMNLFWNTADTGGGNANLTGRRTYIAGVVTAAADPLIRLSDVKSVTGSGQTIDGTHLNNVGNMNVAAYMITEINPTTPGPIGIPNLIGGMLQIVGGMNG